MKYLVIFLASWLIVSCNNTSTNNIDNQEKTTTPLPKGVEYKILDEESKNEDKATLYVKLNKKITEDGLKIVAENIRSAKSSYKRLFIFYYLDDNYKKAPMPWATSHFNPKLDVDINGISIQQDSLNISKIKNMKEPKLYLWLVQDVLWSYHILYEKPNKEKYMKILFKDGSESDEKVYIKNDIKTGVQKFKPNKDGEYYTIDKEGNLSLYNKENELFTTAKKINIP